MHKEFQKYLDEIFPEQAKGLSSIREEFLTHLEDSAQAFQEEGYSEEEAVKRAIESFGDSGEMRSHVEQVQNRRKFWVYLNLLYLFLGSLSLSILYAITLVDGWEPLPFNPWQIVKTIQVSSALGIIFFFMKCKNLRKRML